MPVLIPNQPQGPASTLIPAAASVVGGAFGGPAGAAVGAKIGGMATASGPGAKPIQGAEQAQNDALSRRMQLQQNTPEVQLAQADAALKQLPPEYQQQYGPAITAAKSAAQGGY